MDESEIEWRLLPDEDWVSAYDLSLKKGRVQLLTLPLSDQHNWPGHILKKRYLKLKKDVEGSENMPVSPTLSLIAFLKSARLMSRCVNAVRRAHQHPLGAVRRSSRSHG